MTAAAHGPTLVDALERQAAACERLGSPLYGRLLAGLLADHLAGGLTSELLVGVSERPVHDAVPLRYLGAVHRLALAGDAPELARHYPSCGGEWHGEDLTDEFLSAVVRHRQQVAEGLRRNVQTNEVGRAAALAPAFALLGRRHGLPLDQLEIGSSAGLLSRWDRYRYDTEASSLGDPDSTVRFGPGWWDEPAPSLAGHVEVRERAASDLDPVDVSTPSGRDTMLSFVWPDQVERIERLRCALDIAARHPMVVEREDAGEWLGRRLRGGPRPGAVTVVFHSIVWQYLSRATRDAVRRAFADASAVATERAPLAWLRLEPATAEHADVRLTTWPGGAEEVLAHAGYHGAGVRWLGETSG